MKADLHRHFGGSISVGTIAKISGMSVKEVHGNMVYKIGDKKSYKSFFNKFKILDEIEWDLNKIELSIQDVVWGIKSEGINYAEIKFSVNKYLPYINNMTLPEMVSWFAYCFDDNCSKWGVEVDLILSLKHNMPKDVMTSVGMVIKDQNVADCIAGIDVVGDENYFDYRTLKPIYDMWHEAGKLCLAHVGEINKPDNVYNAINHLKIDRVCHGICCADDSELAKITRDNNIAFDVCISSNMCTGVATLKEHPVKKMIENGFIVNIGTDDPVIFDTTLDREYHLFQMITGINDNSLQMIKDSAVHFSAKEVRRKKTRRVNKNV